MYIYIYIYISLYCYIYGGIRRGPSPLMSPPRSPEGLSKPRKTLGPSASLWRSRADT